MQNVIDYLLSIKFDNVIHYEDTRLGEISNPDFQLLGDCDKGTRLFYFEVFYKGDVNHNFNWYVIAYELQSDGLNHYFAYWINKNE